MSVNTENVSSFIPTPHPERLFSVTLVNGFDLLREELTESHSFNCQNQLQRVEEWSWTSDQIKGDFKKLLTTTTKSTLTLTSHLSVSLRLLRLPRRLWLSPSLLRFPTSSSLISRWEALIHSNLKLQTNHKPQHDPNTTPTRPQHDPNLHLPVIPTSPMKQISFQARTNPLLCRPNS